MTSTFTPLHRGGSGEPLVCLHGFTDTWRTWELILPKLEEHHDVLAPTLLGHAGGSPLPAAVSDEAIIDGIEQAMDEAGFETAHVVGNSLGGYAAMKLASRGRARSVVALAPAGGWPRGDATATDTLEFFRSVQQQLTAALPHVDAMLSTAEGRRLATAYVVENFDHIPVELLKHQVEGIVGCDAAPLIEFAERQGFEIDAEKVECPIRVIWGTADKILAWPLTGTRYLEEWAVNADWVVIPDIGHMPQLDAPTETAQLILDFTSR